MKAKEVKLGSSYHALVSGKQCRVTVQKKNPHGGWDGKNEATGRQIRIKSAQRLTPILDEATHAAIKARLAARKEQKAARLAAAAEAAVKAILTPPAAEPAQPEPAASPEPAQQPAAPAPRPKAPRQDLSHIDWPAMAARWRAGEPLGKLAADVGCSWNRIWSELARCGVDFKTEKQPKPAATAPAPAAAS